MPSIKQIEARLASMDEETPSIKAIEARLAAMDSEVTKEETGFIEAAQETVGAMAQGAGAEIASGLAGVTSGLMGNDDTLNKNIIKDTREFLSQNPDQSQRSKDQMASIGKVVQGGMDLANMSASGIAGIAQMFAGKSSSEIAKTIEGIQSKGLSQSMGDASDEAGFHPAISAGMTALPTAAMEMAGLGAIKPAMAGVKTGASKAAPVINEINQELSDVAAMAPEMAKASKESITKGITDAFQYQTPAKKKMAERIAERGDEKELARYEINERGNVVKDKIAVDALDQGFDEGVVQLVKTASNSDRKAFKKMLDTKEKGIASRRYGVRNRASNVLGESLLKKVDAIRGRNTRAGAAIDKEAKALRGKPINIESSVNGFADSLENLGVSLVVDKNGRYKADFSESQLPPGDRGPLKEIIRQMDIDGSKKIDAAAVHRMKKKIDNLVTFGREKTGLSGDAGRAMKSFRASLDNDLDSIFPAYDKANIDYSETITALNSLQDALGTKLDLRGDNASKAMGTKLRTLLSKNATRINLLDAVDDIDAGARMFGPDDVSLHDQVIFVDELERQFGSSAQTSLQGDLEKVAKKAGSAAVQSKFNPLGAGISAAEAGKAGMDAMRGKSDSKAFAAMREMLKE